MFSFLRRSAKSPRQHSQRARRQYVFQQLEDRSVLSAIAVTNLNDSGPGSLRQAITTADAAHGSQTIDFNVAGTIHLTSGALPAVTASVDIDGTSAPGFAAAPVVEIDFNHFTGLQFNAGSSGSTLSSLSLVGATGAGVALNAGGDTLLGDYIGLALDGMTVDANGGNGLELNGSSGNTIGGAATQDRNVISGNHVNGIFVNGSSSNVIEGNYIGTDATGAVDLGNTQNGILVTGSGAKNNTIGGTTGNVISGNNANGVLVNGSSTLTTVSGNTIGLAASGSAALGNTLDGVLVQNSSGNLIGQSNPVTSVTYNSATTVDGQPVSAWQGIRNSDTAGQYLLAGTSGSNGLLFDGTMAGVGTSYLVNYPGSATTSVYGPDNQGSGNIALVGSYKNSDASAPTTAVKVNGFVFTGTTAALSQGSDYQTIDYPGAEFNYVHSEMGGLAVGNYDSANSQGAPIGAGNAYVYNVAQQTFTAISYPGSKSNTAYGIWYNGGTSYTIAGGWSPSVVNNALNQNQPIGQAYLVDYDSATGKFTNWTSFSYPHGTNFVTHFEGISSVEKGVYTLSADSVQAGSTSAAQGSLVSVTRSASGAFGPATWVNLNYTAGGTAAAGITSSNSVYGNQVVGVVIGPSTFPFQATVNVGFQLSNVIGGNGTNGVELNAASNNQVAMNYIGTDVTGEVDLGNARNGILVTGASTGNMIGGVATGGNDPTGGDSADPVFVRPPQGNLISGNGANGVLITGGASQNQLSGNYIGTDAAGTSALGNTLDGVAIVGANSNSLLGCTFEQNPFVFYNVISGNGGNGVRVTNSNNTAIQANFIGIGADNLTPLGNTANGVLVEGSSTNTTMGGPVPLGNVDAANGQNGILVQGTASYFTAYNTFCGVAAFQLYTNLGNHGDGMLITSTGGNNLIRTNVIGENGNDGIELSGSATGVRVAGNDVGLDSSGNVALGNHNNGIEVDGNANGDIIGGPQPTFNLIAQNAISANGANGVAVDGHAHNITVSHSYIGTDLTGSHIGTGGTGQDDFGNAAAGVYLGPGTYANMIGSADPTLLTIISGNLGDGVQMNGTTGNSVIGSYIGTDVTGLVALGNAGNGISITNSSSNVIGHGSGVSLRSFISNNVVGSATDIIANNGANGVLVASGSSNAIRDNSIYGNTLLGIDLATGANQNQAAPVLGPVQTLPSSIQITGTLTGVRLAAYTIDLYANDTNSPSGRIFLGVMGVTTNSAGLATFTYSGPRPPAGASYITATATDSSGNTSEFSAAVS